MLFNYLLFFPLDIWPHCFPTLFCLIGYYGFLPGIQIQGYTGFNNKKSFDHNYQEILLLCILLNKLIMNINGNVHNVTNHSIKKKIIHILHYKLWKENSRQLEILLANLFAILFFSMIFYKTHKWNGGISYLLFTS